MIVPFLSHSADAARNNSERIRNEAVRLIREREDRTITTQRDADRRLGERLHDVTHWRSELQVRPLFLEKFKLLVYCDYYARQETTSMLQYCLKCIFIGRDRTRYE